jgi:mRNA interferase MazF
MVIKRGEIWWADLGEPQGSAPGFERPILIVSADSFNRSKINTIVGLVITSNVRLADAPGNVLLAIDETGLDRPSVVNSSQFVTLDKSDLRERLGVLSPDQLRLVEHGLRRVLSL